MPTIEVKPDVFSYVYSPYLEPVAVVKPGDDVIVYTEDAVESRIKTKADLPKKALANATSLNPQTGPIYVEGAEPGDTLAVTIKSIEFTRDFAFSAFMDKYGSLSGGVIAGSSLMDAPMLEEEVFIWKVVDDGKAFYEEDLDIKLPAAPFFGTFGVAPALEAISSFTPGRFGGNMDCLDVCAGNTIYLPVYKPGALFYIGDCHGAQGQGEICGFALEITAKGHLQFDIIKNKSIKWPRVESPDKIMVVGSAAPMEIAGKIAYTHLIDWMASDYGFTKGEAYQLLTQAGGLYVTQMVDSLHTLVASIEKKYLKRCKDSK